MKPNILNSAMSAQAHRHRSTKPDLPQTFIVRRNAEAFTLRNSRFPTTSIDSLWDHTLLDRLRAPLTRYHE